MLFKELDLGNELIKALDEVSHIQMTSIQEQSIPLILEGKDVIGLSNTGTGKTASFVLPVLKKLMNGEGSFRSIILAPTRELAQQIGNTLESYSKYTSLTHYVIFGSRDALEEVEEVDILVTTPVKLQILLEEKMLSLENLEMLVFDEADKMIEMGFMTELKKIKKKLPVKRQVLLFSATLSSQIEELAHDFLKDSVKVEVQEKGKLEEFVLFVSKEKKDQLLLDLLQKKEVKSAIVFANSTNKVDDLIRFLTENKVKSEAFHSAKSQFHRDKVIRHMREGSTKFLIATDLASRGLDLENLTHIINYEVPTKTDDYTHRVGRVARAGKSGVSFTLCSSEERNFFKKIENSRQEKIELKTHAYHSETALKAKGKDAKPKHKSKRNNVVKKNKFVKSPKKAKRS